MRVEALEPRQLLAGDPANIFAIYDGAVPQGGVDTINLSVASSDFTLSGGKTILGLQVIADGGALDPSVVLVRNRATGAIVAPLATQSDLANGARSLAVVELAAGNYSFTVGADRGTSGAYSLRTFLVGDVDGDRKADATDGKAINAMLGATAGDSKYKVEADANLDGKITSFDYNEWRANVGDATALQPMALSLGVSPTPTTIPGIGLASNRSAVGVVGTTRGGASVALETQGDGQFDDGSATAASGGAYTIAGAALAEGGNALRVRATSADGFTQRRFADLGLTVDTHAPTVSISQPANNLYSRTSPSIVGTAADSGVGLASLTATIDGGSPVAVTVDSAGNFRLDTSLAEGAHVVHLDATDRVGNASSPPDLAITIDTKAPTISVTAPAAGSTLAADAHLTGSVNGTGSPITSVSYILDSGFPIDVAFDATTGAFDLAINQTNLTAGSHTLTVQARDAAGNASNDVRTVVVAQATTPFAITSYTPSNGAFDVGVTFRPKITFSTPVDVSTLNSSNFYASFGGKKLNATIVPADDGSFAWLFFDPAMPNAAEIRVTVDGSTILSADGGTPLDADADGTAGGVLTFDFATVNLVPVANTTLSGIVVDPGDDLKPHTADDTDPGPDGMFMTEDDTFLHPIAGVKVYLIGLEGQAVVTGPDGRFHFDAVPIGNTKVVLDGLSTGDQVDDKGNAFYYPEMVMDTNILPGVDNVMMMMGMDDGMSMPMPEAFLPRISKTILNKVDSKTGGMITVSDEGAPDLTADQRQNLNIDVAPGSLVGKDGKKLDSAQIGISTVPAELVMDMLPPGVLQHTFDITVQALGVATFSEPAPMTFPNVFNSAPGTKLDFLSFDHTTGRLVIEGTATVSEDGLSVHTDPGTGITHPGWHGLTPPGGCGGSGGPPPPPPPPPDPAKDKENKHDPIVVPLLTGEAGDFPTLKWMAPDRLPDTPPPPPAPPNCNVPPRPPDGKKQQPSLTVNIEVDGPLDTFLKTPPGLSGGLPLSSYAFTLQAGQSGTVIFAGTAKTYDEMLGAGKFKDLKSDQLYGAKVKVTEIRQLADGSRTYDYYTYYIDRYVDASDDDHGDKKLGMLDTLVGVDRTRTIELKMGSDKSQLSADGAFAGTAGNTLDLKPTAVGAQSGTLTIKTSDGKGTFGTLGLYAEAPPVEHWYVDPVAFKDELKADFSTVMTAAEQGIFGTADAKGTVVYDDKKTATFVDSWIAQAESRLSNYTAGLVRVAAADGNTILINKLHSDAKTGADDLGAAHIVDESNGKFTTKDIYDNRDKYTLPEQEFRLSRALNSQYDGHIDFYVDHFFTLAPDWAEDKLKNTFGHNATHEIGHEVGLVHTNKFTGGFDDIMGQGFDGDNKRSFSITDSALRLSLGMTLTDAQMESAVKYYNTYWDKGAGNSADPGTPDPNTEEAQGPLLGVFSTTTGEDPQPYDFGSVLVAGAGVTETMKLVNIGTEPFVLGSVAIVEPGSPFSISGYTPGAVLQPGDSRFVTVKFLPSALGPAGATLQIFSGASNDEVDIDLLGTGVAASGRAVVTAVNNNLGGVPVAAGSSSVPDLITITNYGLTPLHISDVQLAEGTGRFALTGIPGDLVTTPLTLGLGESFTFGATFDPDHLGLDRAMIDVVTDDPAQSVLRVSAVGTGLDQVVYPAWGNDYVALDTPGLAGSTTLRTVSDNQGNFGLFLPPSESYQMAMFDPDTGLVSHSVGMTAPSGSAIDLTLNIVFRASTAPDSDFDGLPDDVEHAVGTNEARGDTNHDAIDDYSAIKQGIDPLGMEGLPVGIIGTVRPQGNFFVHDVVASADTAYLAAGNGGIQVVDISKITKPVVIASVPSSSLGGDALAVSFTSVPGAASGTFQDLVAAALGNDGVAIVDVTDPPAAHLITRVPVPGSALSVQIVDNLAYVGGTGGLVSILDMKTHELIATFTAAGSGDVTAVKFSAGTLYTLRGGTLASYNIGANLGNPPLLSTIGFPGATGLTVGTDRAYVTGNQVLEAVDISDPTNLRNTSGERPALNYLAAAVNGSGRMIVAETATFDGNFRAGLFNVDNPDNTSGFLTEFDTPGAVQSIFIQNGLGLIADGSGGFAIFNYLPFDQGTTPPTISVTTSSPDGKTAFEGSRLRVDVSTLDDVQTRQVSLSANGVALEPDGSFPFSFFVDVPTLASGRSSLNLLVTATDTAGNQSSKRLHFDVVRDTVAPRLLSVLPSDDKIQFNSVQAFRASFDEPLDLATLNASTIHVVEAGPDGKLDTADDVNMPLSGFDFRLSVDLLTITPTSPLGPGKYELQIDRSAVTDRAGNPIGTGLFKSQVTVQAIPFNAVIPGSIDSPGEIDLFSFRAHSGDQVTLFADWRPNGSSLGDGQISILAPDGSTVLASGEGSGSTLLPDVDLPADGLYTVRIRAASTRPLAQGAYRFTISDPETDYETIAYGQTKSGQFAVRGDDQEWQFSATAGDLVSFDYVGPTLSQGITLRKPDGTVESITDPGSTIVRFATAVDQTGVYRFVLDDDNSVGAYTIQLDQGDFADVAEGKFNVSQSGSLDRLYDVDRYRYHLSTGDQITVFANMGGLGAGTVRLLDATTLAELEPGRSGSSAQLDRYTSDATRDVLVEIRGVTGASFHTGTYTLTVSDPETAFDTIAFGQQKAGAFAVKGDQQEWQFVAAGGEEITLGYRGPNLGAGIVVKRPDGTTFATLPAGSTLVGRELKLDQAGTYRFLLADENAVGAYTLNLSDPADIESPGAALAANTAYTDTLGTVFDVDVYTFTASAGDAFSLLGEWRPGGAGVAHGEVALYAPGGALVGRASGDGAVSIAVASASAGVYTARVRAASGDDFALGNFRLTAYRAAEVPTNDTLATAIVTGIATPSLSHYQVTGFIGDNLQGVRDVDMYRVQAHRGDQIVADMQTAGSDLRPYVRLFDASGNPLAANAGYLTYTVLADGAYTVGISSAANGGYDPTVAGSGSPGSVGAYVLTLDVAKDFTGPKVTSITPKGTSSAEDVTGFTVVFNERLNGSVAASPSSYALVSAGGDGIFDTGDDATIALTASYNEAARTVTLGTGAALPVGATYRLTVLGTGSSAITDIAGNPLNDGIDEVSYLELVTTVGTPTTTYPLTDGFEAGTLASYWSVSTTGSARVAVTDQAGPHGGTYHARLDNPGPNGGRAGLTLLLDYSAQPDGFDADLSYQTRESDGNNSMPTSFSGRVNADGVAISNDGVNWYRIDDLGGVSDGSYREHVLDLDGAVRSAGLTFAHPLYVLFQHYLNPGESAYFDDIHLAPDLTGPTVVGVSTPGPLIFSSSLNSIAVDFSEPLQALSANAASSYELRRTDTNAVIGLTPTYDNALRRVTLATAGVLAQAPYRLTIRGNPAVSGTTQVRDANGNPLNNGADSVYTFELFAREATPDDELGTAVATGVTSGASYAVTTAIGNNDYSGRDVDLYKFVASAGDRLTAYTTSQGYGVVGLNTLLRLFNADGKPIASNDDFSGTDSRIDQFQIPAAGTYYIGVSSSSNSAYNPAIAPTGTSGPQGKYALNLVLVRDTTAPTVAHVVPHAGPNENQSISSVLITFSELVASGRALDASNYSLIGLGADGKLGGGDDTAYSFTTSYNPGTSQATLTLTGPDAGLPLPLGSYLLTVKGTAGGIADIAGNLLGGGSNFVSSFRVIAPEDPLNDRLADAYDAGIPVDGGAYQIDGTIGDNAFGPQDVDLFRVHVRDGLRLTVTLNDRSIDSPLSARVRLFNASGGELTASESGGDDTLIYDVTAEGDYYVGISGSGNYNYNPASPGSGNAASTTGEYILQIRAQDVIAPTMVDLSPSFLSTAPIDHLDVQFSEPMNVTAAEAASSYGLVWSGPDRQFGTADDASPSFAVFYNDATRTARLTPSSPIGNGDVRLVLKSNALTDRAGLHLNGGADTTRIVSVATVGAALPSYSALNTAPLPASWILNQEDPNAGADITGAGGPRQGAGHLRLQDVAGYYVNTTATAILVVSPVVGSPLELSFYAKRGQYESAYTLPDSFTGNAAGDGVAIGTDGLHWYRAVDLATQSGTNYDHYVVDLAAAAATHGLSLASPLLIRFSNTEYYPYDPSDYVRYFDDVRVAAGPTAPVATGLTPSTFLVTAAPTSIGVTFSQPVTPASVTDPANYTLVRAGADGVLGTADDVTVTPTGITYNAATRTATLTASALPDDAYRLTVRPGVVDASGVPLNEGLAQAFDFDVAKAEASENETIGAATSTGLVAANDGAYSIVTAIGNNPHGASDTDVYSLQGGAGQRLAVTARRFGLNGTNVKFRLLDASGSELASAQTTSGNSSASIVIQLPSTQTYYVSVTSSDSPAGVGLYHLNLATNIGVVVPPVSEGFESATLPLYFTTYASDNTGLVATSTNYVHTGSRSLVVGDNDYGRTLVEAIATFDGTAQTQTQVSFNVLAPYYEFYYYYPYGPDPLAPAGGHFTGHTNADGVSFSVDGSTWYPVVNYADAFAAGKFGYGTWTRFAVDLSAAAAKAGVALTDHTQLKFQTYTSAPASSNFYSGGYYYDDLRIDSDVIGPSVASGDGIDGFLVATSPTALHVTFNEALAPATATVAANYVLRGAGADGLLDTSDDQVYAATPTYDQATHTTTLAVTNAPSGLPVGNYRLTVIGAGANALTDLAGNHLYDGANKDFVFALFPPEGTTNNTLATATSTGITASGGGYRLRAMLGNDGADGVATFTDDDLYRIDGDAGQVLYVQAASLTGSPNLRIRLFDAAGAQVTFADPSSLDSSLDHFALPAAGTYYVGISDSADDAYDPATGLGDVGTTRGLYDLTIGLIHPAAFPFSDGFESGAIDPAAWDAYSFRDESTANKPRGDVRAEHVNPLPISGNYSAVLSKSTADYGYGQADLTLHLDLTGQTNVELRFTERNNYDYYYGDTTPASYSGRDYGIDGVFLSVDGATYYRLPNLFTGPPGTAIQQVVDLDEFAALNGLTLGAKTEIRFQDYQYYYDVYRLGRSIDDVRVITDAGGPRVTALVTDGNNSSTTRLNDDVTQFVATFDDRLNASRAAAASSYQLLYAGADGLFPGEAGDTGDDSAVALAPSYDGNFTVTLGIAPGSLPLTAGRYRLTFRGTGGAPLTDREGNVLDDGKDEVRNYTLVADGPRVTASTPASNSKVATATGLSTVGLTFSTAILPSSFTSADVQVLDADGFSMVAPADITVSGSGTSWTISFPAIHAPGTYTVVVGPDVTDLAGHKMNQDHDLTLGESFDDAYRTTILVGDSGSTTLLDAGGYRYDIDPFYGEVIDGGDATHGDSYDGTYYLQVGIPGGGSTTYTGLNSTYALADSGRTIVTATRTLSGVRVHREIYVPTGDGQFARFLEVLTNPGTTQVTRRVTITGNLGSDGATVITASGSGDLTFGTDDNYLNTDDGDGIGDLSLGHVLMDGKGNRLTTASLSGDNLSWSFDVTIAPGETVRVMTFAVQQQNRATAQAQASNLVGLPAGTLANLTDAQKGSIVNFSTGVDVTPPLIASTSPTLAGIVQADVSSIALNFTERLVAAAANSASSYTLTDAGPDGVLDTADDVTVPLTPAYDDASHSVTLTIDPAQAPLADGLHRLVVSSAITDLAGNLLNGGTPSSYSFTIFRSGARVTSVVPDGTTASGGWSSVDITFDKDVDAATFTGDDLAIVLDTTGESIVDPADFVVTGSGSSYHVAFPAIHDPGQYTLHIGPGIDDLFGRPMNQDGDQANGEPGDDEEQASFLVSDDASTSLTDVSGATYYVDPGNGSLDDGNIYRGYAYLQVGGDDYSNDFGATALRDGGRTLVLPRTGLGGLIVHRELFVPGDDTFARFLDTFSNPTDAPVTTRISYQGLLRSGSNGISFVYDSDGNGYLDPSDTFVVTGSDFDPSIPMLGHVFADGRRQVLSDASAGFSDFDWSFSVTLAPRQTVRLMSFTTQNPDTSYTANLANLSGSALANLSPDTLGTVLNFDTGYDSVGPVVTSGPPALRFDAVTSLSLNFNEPLDATTASDPANYTLVGAGVDGVLGTADDATFAVTPFYDGTRFAFLRIGNGSTPLPINAYRLTVGGGITDVAGNPLGDGSPRVFDFQVLDNGPYVVSAVPDHTTPEAGFSSATYTFSEAIDPATFTAGDVTITDALGHVVVAPADIAISGSGAVWTVSFPTIHAIGDYRFKVGPNITDLAGHAMNTNFNATFGEDPGDASLRTFTVTDVGGNRLLDQGGFLYDIYPNYGAVADGGRVDGSGKQTDSNSYDYYPYFYLTTPLGGGTYYNPNGAYGLEDGGRTIRTADQPIGGLAVHREIYVPEDDTFVRYLDTVTNSGSTDLVATVYYFGYFGSGNSTQLIADSSGNRAFDAKDTFFVTDDGTDGGGTLSLGHVIMNGNGLLPTYNYFSNGYNLGEWGFTFTVRAGTTVHLMTLDTQQADDASATSQASRLVGLPATALAFLSDDEKASILNFPASSPLRAATPPASGPSPDAPSLTSDQLGPIVAEAIARWAASGLDASHLAILRSAEFRVRDIAGSELGLASPASNVISIDATAGGLGWYVDATPSSDEEYVASASGRGLVARPDGPAARYVDLLTVVEHELGHLLGLGDDADPSSLMDGLIGAGERQLALPRVGAATAPPAATSRPSAVAIASPTPTATASPTVAISVPIAPGVGAATQAPASPTDATWPRHALRERRGHHIGKVRPRVGTTHAHRPITPSAIGGHSPAQSRGVMLTGSDAKPEESRP